MQKDNLQNNLHEQLSAFLATASHPLVAIAGPTASGKTDLSLDLAQKFHGEIINADSRQFFRGMEIGTNVLPVSQRRGIPHHLFTFLDPDQVFTLAQYQQKAFETIDMLHAAGKIPFLVGGTGLYVNAVALNYNIPAIPPNPMLRQSLQQKLQSKGFPSLLCELEKLNPALANEIQPGKTHFLIRALEREYFSQNHPEQNQSMSKRNPQRYSCFFIFLDPEMSVLRERIPRRIEEQLKLGLLDEVRALMGAGYGEKSHAMNGIGYQEWSEYLRGEIMVEEATNVMISRTIQYARRQKTWFRGLRKELDPHQIIILP